MLKFFYRLKRKGGVVLFAVIAIMTLLIAMASTAYLSARASYQTVVSNYDFSQLYLSTTSVSDMLIGALTQSTTVSAANNYSGLKTAVEELKGTKTKGKFIEGYSSNIYASKGGSADDILMAAASDPVEPGIIDGVKVKITLEDFKDDSATATTEFIFSIKTTGYYRNNIVLVEDSVYNKVQTGSTPSKTPTFDTFFTNTGGSTTTKGDRAVVISTEEISDRAYFENKYTIFDNMGSGSNNIFKGSFTSTGSIFFDGIAQTKMPRPGYVWKTSSTGSVSEVSEPGARHDWFINGDFGIFSDNAKDIDLNGNNLYVNGDLILGSQQKLRANNIYVTGNVYFVSANATVEITDTNGNTDVTAGGFYVGGNVYHDTPSNMQLWNEDHSHANSKFVEKYGSAWTNLESEYNFVRGKASEAAAELGVSGGGDGWSKSVSSSNFKTRDDKVSLYIGGDVDYTNIPEGKSDNTTAGLTERSLPSDVTSVTDITVTYATPEADKAAGKYVYTEHTSTIGKLFDEKEGVTKPNNWTTYTAKSETMENILELDCTSVFPFNSDDGWGFDPAWLVTQIDQTYTTADGTYVEAHKVRGGGATYKFYSSKDTTHTNPTTLTYDSNNGVTIDIAFNKNGYLLELPSATQLAQASGGKGSYVITYNIHTDETIETSDSGYKGTMPIVLAANYNDGSTSQEDSKHNNAFSWTGGAPDWSGSKKPVGNNASMTLVNIVNKDGTASAGSVSGGKASKGGNVIFEMGNIDKTTGDYVVFDNKNPSKTDSVTYHAGSHDLVGTLNQTTLLKGAGKDSYSDPNSGSKYKDMLEGVGSDVKPEYENRIMLISNKDTKTSNSGFAYKSDSDIEMFCGYIYAPNGVYGNDYGNKKIPVFGGIITSEMIATMATYIYGEPDPNIVAQMLTGLSEQSTSTSTGTPTEGIWLLEYAGHGKNYLG